MHGISLNGAVRTGTMVQAQRHTVHSVFDKLTWDRISFRCCVSISNSYPDINQILYKVVQKVRDNYQLFLHIKQCVLMHIFSICIS